MAQVTKAISPVPAGIVRLHLYEGTVPGGLFAEVAILDATPGRASITFEATEAHYYRFRLEDDTGALSAYSSAWYYGSDPRTCAVVGSCLDPSGLPVAGVAVSATLTPTGVLDAGGDLVEGKTTTTSGIDGTWALPLVRSALLRETGAKYTLTVSGKGFSRSLLVTVPDAASVAADDLLFAGSLNMDLNLSFFLNPDSAKWVVGDVKRLLVDVAEADNKVTELTGCAAAIRIEDATGTAVVDWTEVTLSAMQLQYLWDTSALEAGVYYAKCRITDPEEVETVHTQKPFRMTLLAA